jgi:oxygen-independent coproporphyrinogen-3 oxidase
MTMKNKNNSDTSKGIYIHIPFCVSKCIYCDFTSYPSCSQTEQQRYFDALKREASLAAVTHEADSIFIGGGTPSSVDAAYIADVLAVIPKRDDAEITIECNPATLTAEKLSVYRNAGINRLSIGVQSFNDDELRFLGRIHTASEAEEAFKMARQAGFDNINTDLIFGFPGQTLESWRATLDRAMELEPEHISFYSLQIEEGTPLYEMFRHDKVEQLTDDVNRKMYHTAADILKANGYVHYEISNAAKPGRECRHNIKYWSMAPYIGLGAAAHSFDGCRRFFNPDELDKYEAAVDLKCQYGSLTQGIEVHENSLEDSITDCIFTSLRLTDGLDINAFKNMFGVDILTLKGDVISRFTSEKYLEISNGKLRFTPAGLDISNYIIGELIF